MLTKKTTTFVMPSLADVDTEFAKLEQQLVDLNSQKAATDRELAGLREELAESRGPTLPAAVAALLGEEPDSATGKRQRAAELSKLAGELTAAIDIVSQRIRDRRDIAKRPLIAAIRDEYTRRAVAVAESLDAISEPLRHLNELRLDFDAHDVAGYFAWPNGNLSGFASEFISASRKAAA